MNHAAVPSPGAGGSGAALRTLALTTLQQMGLTMIRFGLPVLVPFVRSDLRLTVFQVGVVLMALDLGSFVSFIPIGLAADRLGARRVLIAGGLLMGVAAASTALAPSFLWLLLGLLVAGIGFPSGHTAGNKLVMRVFPPATRGMAIGIRMSGLPAGGALASVIIPAVAAADGWRPALAVIGTLCALAAALCVLLPRDQEAPPAGRITLAPMRELAADRGYLHLSLMGAALGTLILLTLAALPRALPGWPIAGVALACGLFLAGWNALFINLLTERVGAARAATAIGGSLTAMFLATMASYPLFGLVVQAAGSYSPAWLLVAACQIAALVLLARVREP